MVITYLFIPWGRVLLEKLTDSQLVKKFPLFYGARRFITAFTSARHLSLSWASSIQSIPSRPTSWRSILILSSRLRLMPSRELWINVLWWNVAWRGRHLITYLLSYLVTCLLTYSMVLSLSWEANWFAASQEIRRISRHPKVHYRTHNRPPPVSILGQPYPLHIPTSHLLQIRPNIIHPSTPRSPQWSPSLRFSHQDPIHPYREITYLLHGADSFLRS